MTGEQMCEVVSWALYESKLPPKDIWNASPTGELWHVFELFERAEQELAEMGLGPKGASDD